LDSTSGPLTNFLSADGFSFADSSPLEMMLVKQLLLQTAMIRICPPPPFPWNCKGKPAKTVALANLEMK